MRSRTQPCRGPLTAPCRGLALLALLALALALPPTPGHAAGEPGLRIANKSFEPATGTLRYELWNDTDKIITAWRLSLAAGDAAGRGQSSLMDQDFYLGMDDEAPIEKILETSVTQGPIFPGQRLTATWKVDLANSGSAPAALSIRAVAWIFDDAGHGGSGEAAAALLEARSVRLEEIAAFLGDLRAAGLGTRPTTSRQPRAEELAEELRRRAEPSAVGADLPPAAASVLSATRIDLADWLATIEKEATADPHSAPEIYRDLESALTRELRIGRAQLGPATGF